MIFQGHSCDSFGFVEQVANENVEGDQSESDEDVENDEAEEEDDNEKTVEKGMQSWTFAYARLLNNPYKNGVT